MWDQLEFNLRLDRLNFNFVNFIDPLNLEFGTLLTGYSAAVIDGRLGGWLGLSVVRSRTQWDA